MNKETFSAQAEQINLETYNPTKSFIPTLITALARIDARNSARQETGRDTFIDPVKYTKRELLKNKDTLSQNVISILDVFCMDGPIEHSRSQIQIYNYLDRVTSDTELTNDEDVAFRNDYQKSRVNLGYFLNFIHLSKQASEVVATVNSYAGEAKNEKSKQTVKKQDALYVWTDLRHQFKAENNLKNEIIETRNGVFKLGDSVPESEKEIGLKAHLVTDAKEEIYASRNDERTRRSQKLAVLTESIVRIPIAQSAEVILEEFMTDKDIKELSKIREEHTLALRLAGEMSGFTSYNQESFRHFRDKLIRAGDMHHGAIPNVKKYYDRVIEFILGSSMELVTDRTKTELANSKIDLPDGQRVDALSALNNYANRVAAYILHNPEKKDEPNK